MSESMRYRMPQSWKFFAFQLYQHIFGGGGCCSVGRAVASDARGPRFESISNLLFIWHLLVYSQLYRKDENKDKEARNGPSFKNIFCY